MRPEACGTTHRRWSGTISMVGHIYVNPAPPARFIHSTHSNITLKLGLERESEVEKGSEGFGAVLKKLEHF